MDTEIKELEQKYYIIKIDDCYRYLSLIKYHDLIDIMHEINIKRLENSKVINEYLVLNLDDKIDIPYLMQKLISNPLIKTIYDIRLYLINAILKSR